MKILPVELAVQSIRRFHLKTTNSWWFSVRGFVRVLKNGKNSLRYWSDLKLEITQKVRTKQLYDKVVQLKLPAYDGKNRFTDGVWVQTWFRVIQLNPSYLAVLVNTVAFANNHLRK
jgi:hypothetical protein